MPIKLSKRTEDEVAEQMREGDFRNPGEAIDGGMALLRARRESREAVFTGAAEADRGELLDGEGSSRGIPRLPHPALHDRLKARGFVIHEGQGWFAKQAFRVASMCAPARSDLARFLAALGESPG